MNTLLGRIVLAVVVAVVVTLACVLLGSILAGLKVDIATTVGDFLKTYGAVLGVLAGLWFFFAGGGIRGVTVHLPRLLPKRRRPHRAWTWTEGNLTWNTTGEVVVEMEGSPPRPASTTTSATASVRVQA